MPRLTKDQWSEVREDWHADFLKNKEICKKYNISEQTLRRHAKDEGWRYPRNSEVVPGHQAGYQRDYTPDETQPETETVTTGVDPASVSAAFDEPSSSLGVPHEFVPATEADFALGNGDLAALLDEERRRRIAAESRAAALEKQVGDLRPYVEIPMYETVEDVLEIFGQSTMKDLVAREFAALNRQRTLEGLDRYVLTEDEMAERMVAVAQEILSKRTKFEDENPHRTRVLKMVTPDGRLVQIPAEDQINNMRGSRGDWHTLYSDRGYKILVDQKSGATLCGSLNCWRVAAKSGNQYTELGYCSAGHRRWVEGNKDSNPTLTPIGAEPTGPALTRTGLAKG